MLTRWAPDFEKVIVLGVPSNHTQNRQNGKIATENADDRGLAMMETIAERCGENPNMSHVSFVIPDDEQVVTLDLGGTIVSFTHMHQAPGGGNPQQKAKTWWANQAFGKRQAGDSDLLVSAHYHHLSVVDHGPRVHMQCPAMDGGSQWFLESNGAGSRSGIATFITGAGTTLGDLEVL
jgi:hypothetical protein